MHPRAATTCPALVHFETTSPGVQCTPNALQTSGTCRVCLLLCIQGHPVLVMLGYARAGHHPLGPSLNGP